MSPIMMISIPKENFQLTKFVEKLKKFKILKLIFSRIRASNACFPMFWLQ